MIYLRFFFYGALFYAILALCISMPLSAVATMAFIGGGLFTLSCWAVRLICRILKELKPQ
ncbi:hypothetical protein [Pseudoalteromonas sp. GB56]